MELLSFRSDKCSSKLKCTGISSGNESLFEKGLYLGFDLHYSFPHFSLGSPNTKTDCLLLHTL